MCAAIALQVCKWLYIYDLQIKFEKNLEELCPLRDFTVFSTFFSLLTDIHLVFNTLFYHTKIQIKFEFGFDPLIFREVTALELEKYLEISFFRTVILCLQIV
jgi:hypothetical protein